MRIETVAAIAKPAHRTALAPAEREEALSQRLGVSWRSKPCGVRASEVGPMPEVDEILD